MGATTGATVALAVVGAGALGANVWQATLTRRAVDAAGVTAEATEKAAAAATTATELQRQQIDAYQQE
jgi:hypothetical protein